MPQPMGTVSLSPQRYRYKLTTFSFLCFLVVGIIFFFSNRALEPTHSLYRDLLSETLSFPESTFSNVLLPDSESANASSSVAKISSELDESAVEERDNRARSNETEVDATSNEAELNELAVEEGNPRSQSDESEVDTISNGAELIESVEAQNNDAVVDTESNEAELIESVAETKSDEAESNESAVEEGDNRAQNDESAVGDGGESESGSDASVERLKWSKQCDLYTGSWVKDEEYPVYEPGSCPYVDEAFDCQGNGRSDSEYLKWRWKPDGCDLPRFNATDFLVRLRGKRLLLVGDSMNRNQFESLLCLLREGLTDKSKMYETHGYKITKGRGQYIFKVEDYDCSIEFLRSHFLVKEGTRINGQGNSNPTLSIDRIDKSAARWKRADIIVFNTGHWWTHGKTARGKNYYKEGDYIYPKFDATEAYRRALKTWAKWVDKNLNSPKKLVFYRGYSSAHFRGGDWDSGGTCNGETEPISNGSFIDNYPLKMQIVDEVIQEMKAPVVLLNVTRLTNFRKDGHPSVYGKNVTRGIKVSRRRQDCSHWCLPGVPDAWNELIYATLVFQQTNSATNHI